MDAVKREKLIALAEGSVKTLFALCSEQNDNSEFIQEHMQRWLSTLIEAEYSRREIIDYFYGWQREFEGDECIDEKLHQVFDGSSDLKGEEIHHSWIDAWVEGN